jgi:uncharacterized protein (TIGR02118 family)
MTSGSWMLDRAATRREREVLAAMVKVVYCITKKRGLTDEQFFHYWQNVHGPIGARIPKLQRLVQSRRIVIPEDAHVADYDGVAELWFDDEAALLEARQSPEWKASSDDELNFIDHSRVAYFVSREHTVVDLAGGGAMR